MEFGMSLIEVAHIANSGHFFCSALLGTRVSSFQLVSSHLCSVTVIRLAEYLMLHLGGSIFS